MGGRTTLALALLLGVMPCHAAAAAPGHATIELRGSKSAHVDVRFDEPVAFACCDDPGSLSVRTRGTHAGYLVERLSDRKIVAGALRVPAMDWEPFGFRRTVLVKRSPTSLAPGAYRIHLVADGESTVRFRVDGLDEDASYRPKSPSPVTSSFKTPPVDLAPAHHTTPVEVDEDTWVVVASLLVAQQNQASYLEHCVVRTIEPCQSRRDHSAAISIDPVFNIESLSAIYSVYRPGHFEPGAWQAKFSVASAGLVKKAQTLVLTIY